MRRRDFITLTLATIASPIVVKSDAFAKFLLPETADYKGSYPDLYFTGFKNLMQHTGYHGQFLWYGLFEVKPGIFDPYPWYVNISGDTLAAAEERVNEGIFTAHRLIDITELNKYFEVGGWCDYDEHTGEELVVVPPKRITFTSVQWKSWQEGNRHFIEHRRAIASQPTA